MRLLNRIKAYINLYKLRSYTRKKLAYHEAGHLVFSYLAKIPCEYISVDYHFEDGIKFEGDYVVVTMNSNSQVYHLLPRDLEHLLSLIPSNIATIASRSGKTISVVQQEFRKYFLILLAGHYSQRKFIEGFLNEKLEVLQHIYSKDLTERNLQEDFVRFNHLNTSLYSVVSDRKATFEKTTSVIEEYLEKLEIKKAIQGIASKVKNNKKIKRNEIEAILSHSNFLDYCENEYPNIITKLS